jgi:phage baseplate assembly protein W
MGTSLRTPFSLEGGRIQVTTDQTKQVEQKIIDVLTTSPYERVALPAYGGDLNALLFEDMDELSYADFKTDAALEISRSITGVTIVDIFTELNGNEHATITVRYRLPLSGASEFTFRVAAPYELTEESSL